MQCKIDTIHVFITNSYQIICIIISVQFNVKQQLFQFLLNLIHFIELDINNSLLILLFFYLGEQDWNLWFRKSSWDIPNNLDAVFLVEAGQVRYKGTHHYNK
jgi:hypothetical protein